MQLTSVIPTSRLLCMLYAGAVPNLSDSGTTAGAQVQAHLRLLNIDFEFQASEFLSLFPSGLRCRALQTTLWSCYHPLTGKAQRPWRKLPRAFTTPARLEFLFRQGRRLQTDAPNQTMPAWMSPRLLVTGRRRQFPRRLCAVARRRWGKAARVQNKQTAPPYRNMRIV
jgi:hypothetical protein